MILEEPIVMVVIPDHDPAAKYRHMKALDAFLFADDVINYLRGKLKYTELSECESMVFDDVLSQCFSLLEERGIDLDEALN